MKKIAATAVLVFLISMLPLSAEPEVFTALSFEYSNDTNIFSYPLPQYAMDDIYWLEFRSDHPFMMRQSLGANLSVDYYCCDDAKIGVSTSLSVKIPFHSVSTIPVAEDPLIGFKGDWNYDTYDSLDTQSTAVFWSLGPVFRARLKDSDLSLAIRISIGEYDCLSGNIIIGIQVEPAFNLMITEDLFFTARLSTDSHLARMLTSGGQLFEDNYQMLTVSPSIGMGIEF